jgi:uncharacterized damage-inducible protein DinB
MNNKEFFVERFEIEQPAFKKVLAALPGDKLDYTPHERSTAAGNLAWQLAEEQRNLAELLERGETAYEARKRPASREEIEAAWDKATTDLRTRLASCADEQWGGQVKFVVGGEAAWSDTLQNMMWGFLFDMVHHRGQLSSYLRPMGGKVPAIYGPSGDDRGSE